MPLTILISRRSNSADGKELNYFSVKLSQFFEKKKSLSVQLLFRTRFLRRCTFAPLAREATVDLSAISRATYNLILARSPWSNFEVGCWLQFPAVMEFVKVAIAFVCVRED